MLCVAAEPGFERSRHHYSIPNPLRDQSTFGRVNRHWNRPPLVVVEDWSPVRRFAGRRLRDSASVATAASASQRAAACPGQRGAAARSSRPSAGLRRAPTAAARATPAGQGTSGSSASRASSENNLAAALARAAHRRRRSVLKISVARLLPFWRRRWPRPGAPRRPSGRSPATRCSPCGATPGLPFALPVPPAAAPAMADKGTCHAEHAAVPAAAMPPAEEAALTAGAAAEEAALTAELRDRHLRGRQR